MHLPETTDLVDQPIACQIIGGKDTPIHSSTLWRGVKAGRYPKPIKVGPATNRWRRSELIEVVQQAAARRGEA